MATYNLGRICPAWKGTWNATTNYSKLDVVFSDGGSYMALKDNTNKKPEDNPTDWQPIAKTMSYSDMDNDDKDALLSDFMRAMSTTVYASINTYIQESLQDPSIIQTWLQFVTMSQTEYNALSDKSGIYFVYA